MINQLDDVTDLILANSIGKLFIINDLEVSEGTVFIINKVNFNFQGIDSNDIACFTNYHNVTSIFDTPEEFYVMFQNIIDPESFISIKQHQPCNCSRNIYTGIPIDIFNHSQKTNKSLDPITQNPYSVHNDLVVLVLKPKCPCGTIFQPQSSLSPLDITNLNATEELLLVGYPGGQVSRRIAIPYLPNVDPGTSFVTTGQVLKQSQGFVYDRNDLIAAVSNSSVLGMSGSGMLQRKDGKYFAVGILLGGPAVPHHKDLINIAQCVMKSKFCRAKKILKTITDIDEKRLHKLIRSSKAIRLTLCRKGKDACLLLLQKIYYKLIENYSKTLQTDDVLKELSHNLMLCFDNRISERLQNQYLIP